MKDQFTLSPPQHVAAAYAPPVIRPHFAWALAFDARLQHIIAHAREPLLARMRLQWWHDVIIRDAATRPKGEPMVFALTELEAQPREPALSVVALDILAAWQSALDGSDAAEARADALFGNFARWTDCAADDIERATVAGLCWVRASGRAPNLTKKLRALSLLALAARLEAEMPTANLPRRLTMAMKIFWHGLTGR